MCSRWRPTVHGDPQPLDLSDFSGLSGDLNLSVTVTASPTQAPQAREAPRKRSFCRLSDYGTGGSTGGSQSGAGSTGSEVADSSAKRQKTAWRVFDLDVPIVVGDRIGGGAFQKLKLTFLV